MISNHCLPRGWYCIVAILSAITYSVGFWTSNAQVNDTFRPEVTIPQGDLQGVFLTTRLQRNISGFLGIPYAQPAVGNLRFASPVRADGWNGTRDASEDGNVCPQNSNGVVIGDEDCLHVNVFTPQLPGDGIVSLKPVMVYIYGGAFIMGASTSANPTYLLDQDVVLVVPNYRLGPLGFLSTGDEVASGNWALKDQILALEWVQDNIEYFGGDPGQVTIFGLSAGSACVHLLTLSDLTKGLFHRYITQSGSALSTWAHQPRDYYARRAFELGQYVGCTNETTESLIECLRAVDFTDIIATLPQFIIWESWPEIVWSPTDEPDIEGAVLTDSPANLFSRGAIRDLPWISGVSKDEGLVHTGGFQTDDEKLKEYFTVINFVLPEMFTLQYQSDSGDAWVKALKSYYFNDDLTANTSLLLLNQTLMTSDALFFYPAYKAVSKQFALAESPQYLYIFNYRGTFSQTYLYSSESTENYGVAHGDDMLYIFSPDDKFSAYNKTPSKTDLEMAEVMVQLWTSFAINGTPIIGNDMPWEAYSTEGNYLQIGDGSEVVLKARNSFFNERLEFWTNLETESVLPGESSAVTSLRNSCFELLVVYSILVSIFR